jgi:hypothetical protein
MKRKEKTKTSRRRLTLFLIIAILIFTVLVGLLLSCVRPPAVKYYLTVISPYGTPGGEGWYKKGSNAYATLNTGILNYGNGTRRVFIQWGGDASGTNYTRSNPIYIDKNKTAIADWKTQYLVTFNQTGLSSDATGTVVSINGTAKTFNNLPYTTWINSGAVVTYSYETTVSSTVSGKKYVLNNVTGPASPISVTNPITVTADYKIQYEVTFNQLGVGTDFTGTVVTLDGIGYNITGLPVSFMWINGSNNNFSFASPLVVNASRQYVWTSTSGLSTLQSGTLTVTGSGNVTGNYTTQTMYQITFNQSGINSDYTGTVIVIDGTNYNRTALPVSFMWKAGSVHNFNFQSPLTISPNSKQYVWNSTSGLSTLRNGTITVSTSGSIVGNYKTQYYLTVTSPHDSPTPSNGWFNSETSITESVTSPVSGGSGTQYVCTGWTGTGSVPTSGTTTTTTFTINATSSITWNWKTQYQATFAQTGVGSDFTGTVVTVDSTGYAVGDLPVSFWWDSGSSHTFSFSSSLIVNVSRQYTWISTSGLSTLQNGTLTVTGSGSITGSYAVQAQYQITFNSGVGSDFTGTVVVIDGNNYTKAQLPVSFSWSTGSSHTFVFQSPLIVTVNAKQYVWTNTSGLSTLQSGSIKVTTSGSITGNYKTQYYLTVGTSPLGIVIIPGEGWYNASASVSLNASAVPGYNFINWDVDGSNVTGNPITVTMNAPHTATAHYQILQQMPVPVGGYAAPIEGSQLQAPSINLSLWIGLAFVFLAVVAAVAILIKRRNRIL